MWPFLLGHYQFGMTETERKEVGYPRGAVGSLTAGRARDRGAGGALVPWWTRGTRRYGGARKVEGSAVQ